jgi:signal transduction histidine kinase
MNNYLGCLLFFPSGASHLVVFNEEMVRQIEKDSSYAAPFPVPSYNFQLWMIVLVLLLALASGMMLHAVLNRSRNKKKVNEAVAQRRSGISSTEEHFRKSWDSFRDGLLLSDERGEIVAINPALLKMATLSPINQKTENLSDLFKDPQSYHLLQSLVQSGLDEAKGKGFSADLKIDFKAGAKDVEMFVTTIDSDHNGKKLIFSAFRDVSVQRGHGQEDQEEKQKAKEANQLKTSFLSNMSHEIRTPLNGILGSTANLILRNSHNPELVAQLEIIMQSGERLLHTINNILDMSRIEANKMEIILEEVNLNDFLSKTLLPLKSLAITKGLLITAKYESKPFIANIDKKYFELIINNIVGNAIKYSDNGLIEVKLKKEKGCLYLCVQDKGIGISEEYINKLFNPFEQESVGYDREFEGSGLGLTITKNLIDLLSGEITIKSQKGQGTTVNVILPLQENF